MTYGDVAKAIKAHRGRVYACINADGGQFHVEVKKGEAANLFHNYALTYGQNAECGVSVEIHSGDLYIDTAYAK